MLFGVALSHHLHLSVLISFVTFTILVYRLPSTINLLCISPVHSFSHRHLKPIKHYVVHYRRYTDNHYDYGSHLGGIESVEHLTVILENGCRNQSEDAVSSICKRLAVLMQVKAVPHLISVTFRECNHLEDGHYNMDEINALSSITRTVYDSENNQVLNLVPHATEAEASTSNPEAQQEEAPDTEHLGSIKRVCDVPNTPRKRRKTIK